MRGGNTKRASSKSSPTSLSSLALSPPDAPSGYSPKGKEFDDKLVELVRNYDVEGILKFDPELAEAAGQDALWSIAIMLGALDGKKVKPEVLSYEGPFGVGYMIASFGIDS